MKLKILFICVFTLLLSSCASKKAVVKKSTSTQISEPKPDKLPSVGQEAHIRKLRHNNKSLNKKTLAYIRKYAPIAVHEMYTSKIPASITLAQGILESGNGLSQLASKSNNHFGIKCHTGWSGQRVYHDDDKRGECFRKYKFVANSYKDHSAFLTKRRRYAFLFNYNKKDYKKWAKGLRKAGYATDKKYPKKLIHLIETYQLYVFDSFKSKDYKTVKIQKKRKQTITYIVKEGDTLYAIARKFDVSVSDLKKSNYINGNSISIGQQLLIQK